ncbi:SMI1/KNR4 family protein [Tenacibaculum tangerinum]|uniref:SMI1/KNR4 family protein n=1 Tax=Tenacibaculum tangerinum TaxID=3038772 RepID=A0ABY8KZW5_9FLAO|nr:SMI1/KNR4 family protein [Tenacibaculum tangerinum]WGH74768.1 SMI1/KNR4 family protein [Tenacibaculum tangerinum]
MIHFENTKEPVSVQEIKEFETKFNIKFPESYKLHILKYNGGYPSLDMYFGDFNIPIDSFLSIKHGNQTIERVMNNLSNVLKGKEVPFARSTSGTIYMSLKEEDYGSVYVAYSEWNPKLLAKTFDEFIEGIHEDEI